MRKRPSSEKLFGGVFVAQMLLMLAFWASFAYVVYLALEHYNVI